MSRVLWVGDACDHSRRVEAAGFDVRYDSGESPDASAAAGVRIVVCWDACPAWAPTVAARLVLCLSAESRPRASSELLARAEVILFEPIRPEVLVHELAELCSRRAR